MHTKDLNNTNSPVWYLGFIVAEIQFLKWGSKAEQSSDNIFPKLLFTCEDSRIPQIVSFICFQRLIYSKLRSMEPNKAIYNNSIQVTYKREFIKDIQVQAWITQQNFSCYSNVTRISVDSFFVTFWPQLKFHERWCWGGGWGQLHRTPPQHFCPWTNDYMHRSKPYLLLRCLRAAHNSQFLSTYLLQ